MKLHCEKCPVSPHCEGYQKASKDEEASYHPQEVVRVYYWECPLVKLIELPKLEGK